MMQPSRSPHRGQPENAGGSLPRRKITEKTEPSAGNAFWPYPEPRRQQGLTKQGIRLTSIQLTLTGTGRRG